MNVTDSSFVIENDNSEKEWTLEFHGVTYIITVLIGEVMLTLEIENEETNERWSGEFTAQYIEEITHKAGNFKKFTVFLKMLFSAFYKDNAHISIDILTYADLEMLKAKKMGASGGAAASTSSFSSSASIKQQHKRYAILTYSGEFDRVHYPLPLVFEESPKVSALQRTIKRLRHTLKERRSEEQAPTSDREKEMRQIVAQLRQDNTELRHRMRQAESRSAKAQNSSFSMNSSAVLNGNTTGATPSGLAAVNAELATTNSKLRKQVDHLKKELENMSIMHDKLRTDSAREVAKWKLRVTGGTGGGRGDAMSTSSSPQSARDVSGSGSGSTAASQRTISLLRNRVADLEVELKNTRRAAGLGNSTPSYMRARSPYAQGGTGGAYNNNSVSRRSMSTGTWNSTPSNRANTPPLSRRRSATPTATSSPKSTMSSRGSTPGRSSGDLSIRGRNGSTSTRERSFGGPYTTSSQRSGGSGSVGTGARSSRGGTPTSARSISPSTRDASSSLGGRFDPTSYQQQKLQQLKNSSSKAWGSGPGVGGSFTTPQSSGGSGRGVYSGRAQRYASPGGDGGYVSSSSVGSRASRRSDSSQERRGTSRGRTSSSAAAASGQSSSNGKRKKRVVEKKKSGSGVISSSDGEQFSSADERDRGAAAPASRPVVKNAPTRMTTQPKISPSPVKNSIKQSSSGIASVRSSGDGHMSTTARRSSSNPSNTTSPAVDASSSAHEDNQVTAKSLRTGSSSGGGVRGDNGRNSDGGNDMGNTMHVPRGSVEPTVGTSRANSSNSGGQLSAATKAAVAQAISQVNDSLDSGAALSAARQQQQQQLRSSRDRGSVASSIESTGSNGSRKFSILKKPSPSTAAAEAAAAEAAAVEVAPARAPSTEELTDADLRLVSERNRNLLDKVNQVSASSEQAMASIAKVNAAARAAKENFYQASLASHGSGSGSGSGSGAAAAATTVGARMNGNAVVDLDDDVDDDDDDVSASIAAVTARTKAAALAAAAANTSKGDNNKYYNAPVPKPVTPSVKLPPMPSGDDDISEIGKRIAALQTYLDKARTSAPSAAAAPANNANI